METEDLSPQPQMAMSSAMKPKHPSPSEGEWLKHKEFIQYCFLICNIPLKELTKTLSGRGLAVTKSQLESKLKKWGTSKNLDKPMWQYIDRKIKRRKDDGKSTDVIYAGKRLRQAAIEKGIQRHRETNTLVRIAQSRSPPLSPTNTYLTICTPPSLRMEFEWPASLPWLRFQKTYQEVAMKLLQTDNTGVDHYGIYQIMHTNLRIIRRRQTNEQDADSDALENISKIAANINKTMPEWYEGEHLRVAQTLLHGHRRDAILHCLKLIIYQTSNGLLHEPESYKEWQGYREFLLKLGILKLEINLHALPDDEITVRAFAERLFANAIEWETAPRSDQRGVDLIRWLLKSGQDLNRPMRTKQYFLGCSLWRPVELAILHGHTELVALLLDFGAEMSLRNSQGISSLDLINRSKQPDAVKTRLIEMLTAYDVPIAPEEMLYTAIKLRDLNLINAILARGVDLTRTIQSDCQRLFLFEETALSAAIAAGREIADVILEYIASLNLIDHEDPLVTADDHEAPLITPDTYIAAAVKGDDETIRQLYDIDHNFFGDTCNQRGFKPIHMAVSAGHFSTCELLLQFYDSCSPALLFLAVYRRHKDIFQLLLREGADPNAILDLDDVTECKRVCPRFMEVFQNLSSPTVFTTLFRLSEIGPGSSTGLPFLGKLIESGARLTGREVCHFAKAASVDTLLTALKHGGSPNEQNYRGLSALQVAIETVSGPYGLYLNLDPFQQRQRFDVVKALLEYGAKPLAGDVVSAIRLGSGAQDILPLFLAHGLNLKDTDKTGMSSLEAAIASPNHGMLENVKEVYKGSYDPGSLCAAAQIGYLPLIDELLANRPPHSNYHVFEGTAIGLVAKSGYCDYLQKLFHHVPDVRECDSALFPMVGHSSGFSLFQNTDTPLFWRCPSNFDLLVHASPLVLASGGSNTSGFEELLRLGCRADPLTWIAVSYKESLAHVKLLTEYGQRLDDFPPGSAYFPTALTVAISLGNKELVNRLLNAGAHIDEYGNNKSGSARSALQLSVELGDLELMSDLLGRGANVNVSAEGYRGATALQIAAMTGQLGMARELLDRGAHINARGARIHGRTALEGAAEHGKVDMLEFLIRHGALLNGNGHSQFLRAVKLAKDGCYHTAVSVLKRSGGWDEEDDCRLTGEETEHYCCDIIHNYDTGCIKNSTKTNTVAYSYKAVPNPGWVWQQFNHIFEWQSGSGWNEEDLDDGIL